MTRGYLPKNNLTNPDFSPTAGGRWRTNRLMSTSPANQPAHSTDARLNPEPTGEVRIPVIEETVLITRELVETGRVRLTKTVEERQHILPLDLRHEQVEVQHVPINQFLPDDAPAPDSRREGDTLIIPVLREVMVKRSPPRSHKL
jgi:stress response protein YsnF